jgi:hypothetical protein
MTLIFRGSTSPLEANRQLNAALAAAGHDLQNRLHDELGNLRLVVKDGLFEGS